MKKSAFSIVSLIILRSSLALSVFGRAEDTEAEISGEGIFPVSMRVWRPRK
jgi:hypothetical protein